MRTRRPNKNAPCPAPRRGYAATLMALAFILATGAGAFLLSGPDDANTSPATQRNADADAWTALRGACVDEQAAHLTHGKGGIEECTDYADGTLQAARRARLTLADYIARHAADLRWLPDGLRPHVAEASKTKG